MREFWGPQESSPSTWPSDYRRTADRRTLFLHMRYWLTLGRALCPLAGCCLRSPAGSLVASARGNRGGDFAPVRNLPSPNCERRLVRRCRCHALGLYPGVYWAQGAEWHGVADRAEPTRPHGGDGSYSRGRLAGRIVDAPSRSVLATPFHCPGVKT